MKSPILGIQHGEHKSSRMRVYYSSNEGTKLPGRLHIKVETFVPDEKVSSLEEAEDKTISLILDKTDLLFDNSKLQGNVTRPDAYVGLMLLLIEASNTISKNTRRGCASFILMNEEDLFVFKRAMESGFSSWVPVQNGEIIGRWKYVGKLNTNASICSGPIPRGKIILLYKGQSDLDSLGIYTENENGKFVTLLDDENNAIGYRNYVQVIEMKEYLDDC